MVFLYLLVIGLVMSFVEEAKFLETKLRKPIVRKSWHYIKISCYCLFAVYFFGSVTANVFTDYVFPSQNPLGRSDAIVPAISFLFWGVIGGWIAIGRERDPSEKDPSLATSVGRINWLLERPITGALAVAEWLVKPATWLIIGVLLLLVIAVAAFIGGAIEQSISAMSTPKAVVLAGVIIAVAILAVGGKR